MKYPCTDCNGTGRDQAKTAKAIAERRIDAPAYIRCWTCLGNGTDNWAYFQDTAKALRGE